MVETLLTAVSVLEGQQVAYTVHQGSLLGAARLGGLLPWDIDGDIAIVGESAESAAAKLEQPLAAHGLAFVFSPEAYYYTIRPLLHVRAPGLAPRPVLGFPLVEVILITSTEDAETGLVWHDRHSPHRTFAPGELLPLARYPWHGSHVLGPANAERVLERLYGADGGAAALERFAPPAIDAETAAFWQRARPPCGEVRYADIAARAAARRDDWRRLLSCAPWYLANGVYNAMTESARRLAGGR